MIKEETDISRAFLVSCEELFDALNKILRLRGKVCVGDALLFRANVSKCLLLFEEWRKQDRPRAVRDLRLKYFVCGLVRKRFTLLTDGDMQVSHFVVKFFAFEMNSLFLFPGPGLVQQ